MPGRLPRCFQVLQKAKPAILPFLNFILSQSIQWWKEILSSKRTLPINIHAKSCHEVLRQGRNSRDTSGPFPNSNLTYIQVFFFFKLQKSRRPHKSDKVQCRQSFPSPEDWGSSNTSAGFSPRPGSTTRALCQQSHLLLCLSLLMS